MSDAQPDKTRERLLEVAGSCLDHVRLVKWGEGHAHYETVENDQVIEITISVKCYRKADQANV